MGGEIWVVNAYRWAKGEAIGETVGPTCNEDASAIYTCRRDLSIKFPIQTLILQPPQVDDVTVKLLF
jgi:hypothetical protein